MVNDYLSDMITQIRNGYQAGLGQIRLPWSRVGETVAQVLVGEGYLTKAGHDQQQLVIDLKYAGKQPAVSGIRRISRPGKRVYAGVHRLPRVLGGLGINVVSTPRGVVSDRQARKLGVGGEIICQIW